MSPMLAEGVDAWIRPALRIDDDPCMSPDLLFWLSLALKMAVTAGFVIAAAMVAERAGPAIGAMVATLPIAAGPAYVVRRARPRCAQFISASAIGSIAAHAATGGVLAGLHRAGAALRHGRQRRRRGRGLVRRRVPAALGVMDASSASPRSISRLFGICIALTDRYRHVQMPLIVRKWYDMPVRAFMVACLVAAVVGLSGRVGPTVTGLLAVYPIVMTSLMLIFQPRVGGPATAALIANTMWGLVGFSACLFTVHLADGAARHLGRAAPVAGRLGGVEPGALLRCAAARSRRR